MSRNVAVAIVGSGKTTRNNVESLIADFKDAVDSLTILLPTTDVTEGMIWAKQYAESQEIAVVEDENVYKAIYELNLLTEKTVELKLFVLWDDDDSSCQNAVAFAQEHNIPVFDLTDGLIRIPTDEIKVDARPETDMPDIETNVKAEEELFIPTGAFIPPPTRDDIFEAVQDPLLDWEDDPQFMEGAELIETALEEAGKMLARAFVKEMLALLKDQKKDQDEAE